MHMRRPAVLLILFLASAPGLRAEVTLVRNGDAQAEIVLTPGAPRSVRIAAEELQTLVERSSGARLPIVSTPNAETAHVFLGENPHSAAVGVTPAELRPEGFHLRTLDGDLHIVGRDTPGDPDLVKPANAMECGTLSGVYELLEQTVGVMFCWHDDLGTVVPSRTDLVIPETAISQAPAWTYRSLPYSPEGATFGRFGRRLRLGNAYGVVHRHNWFSICPVETYGTTHPEYFSLVDGKRRTRYYLGRHGGQVCTSNPAVVDLFVEAACEYFAAAPERQMFSLSPNDGGGFCECDACQALDSGDVDPANPDRTVLTDRMLHFYNAIAARVSERYPGKLLGAYIYGAYTRPPRRESVHPALFLVQATNSAHTHGLGWEQEREYETQWAARATHLVKYDIYYRSPSSLHLIAPVTTHLIEKIRAAHAAGLQGGYLYIGQTYEQLGAGHYLLAKMMWNPQADARALEQNYYAALYGGPAGADVLSYYHLLEDRLRHVRRNGIDVDDPGIRHLEPRNVGGGSPAFILAAYWPILEEADTRLRQAAERDLDELQKQRLQRLLDQHQFMVASVRGMVAAARLDAQPHVNQDDVAMLKQSVAARETHKAAMRAYAPTLLAYLEKADQNETAYVSPDGAFYQLTRGKQGDIVQAVRSNTPAAVDGLDHDAAWQTAPPVYLLQAKSATTPALGATARVAWDDTHLYVCVEGREPGTAALASTCSGHDDPAVFADDNVELFLQPPGQAAYYHIGLGAGGAVYDAVHRDGTAAGSDPSWDSGLRAAVNLSEYGWSVECALPFAALGASPGPGWRINVCRTRRGNAHPDDYTAAAPTFGGYHAPERFAALEFATDPKTPVLRYGSIDDVPNLDPLRLRPNGKGHYTVSIVTDQAYCGAAAAHVTVGEQSLASIAFTADVKAETAYRIMIVHRNRITALKPTIRSQAPISRIIFRDREGKPVTDTAGYSWSGADALAKPDTWRTTHHTVTTPPGTERISLTLFLHHPGDYWLDEIRIETM